MEHIKIVCKIPHEIALQDGFLSKLIRKMERQVKNTRKSIRNNMGAAGSIRGYFKCTDYGFINGIIRKQDAKNEHRKNIDN